MYTHIYTHLYTSTYTYVYIDKVPVREFVQGCLRMKGGGSIIISSIIGTIVL